MPKLQSRFTAEISALPEMTTVCRSCVYLMVKGQEQHMQVFSLSVSEEMEGTASAALSPITSAREEPGPAARAHPGQSARGARGARCTDLRVAVHQHLLRKTDFHGVGFQPCPLLRGQKRRLRPALEKTTALGGQLGGLQRGTRGERWQPWWGCSHHPAPCRRVQEL